MNTIHRRQVLSGVAVLFVTTFVKEHAASVSTLLMLQPGRTIFGRSQLSAQDTVAVQRPVHGSNAAVGLLGPLKGDIDAERRVLALATLAVGDGDLLDVSVLAEELGLSQRLGQLVLANRGRQAGHINQVLLNDSNADEVLSVLLLDLSLLRFFLSLLLRSLLLVLRYVGAELGFPVMSRLISMRAVRVWVGWARGIWVRFRVGGTYSSGVTTFHCIVFSS
jgi:hypothetical protein